MVVLTALVYWWHDGLVMMDVIYTSHKLKGCLYLGLLHSLIWCWESWASFGGSQILGNAIMIILLGTTKFFLYLPWKVLNEILSMYYSLISMSHKMQILRCHKSVEQHCNISLTGGDAVFWPKCPKYGQEPMHKKSGPWHLNVAYNTSGFFSSTHKSLAL